MIWWFLPKIEIFSKAQSPEIEEQVMSEFAERRGIHYIDTYKFAA
ncbi:hypothetical protein [Kaistella faecalis]|nr:hypothetical protein [Chryseobacterium faecale]